MKKIIIFDFDGTIADSFPPIVKILKKQVKEMGYGNLTDKQIEVMRSMRPFDIIRHFKFPIWKIPKLIKTVREELFENINDVKIFPGIKDLFYKLKDKNIKFGILTSNSKKTVEAFLNANSINGFEFIESETNIFKKSSHLSYIINKNLLSKDEVVYIGDEVRDIEACREAGVDIISVTWGYNNKRILEKNNPTFLVSSPSEILKLLLKPVLYN